MDYRKQGLLLPDSNSTLQRLKERARSVDRYFSEQRLNILGQSRGGSQENERVASSGWKDGPKLAVGTSSTHGVAVGQQRRSRLTASTSNSSSNLLSVNGHANEQQRGRSPSINLRIQQNLQNLVAYLFERKNDSKKRALAERLLWTAARRNEVSLFKDILQQLSDPAFDVNSPNEFGWNLVDEAVMLGHLPIATHLFKNGARETQALSSKNVRVEFLRKALRKLEAVQVVSRLSDDPVRQLTSADVTTSPSLTLVQQMLQDVEKTRPPRNALDDVRAEIWDENAIALKVSRISTWHGIITRFKVEWSADRHFSSGVDYEIFTDVIEPSELVIDNLKTDQDYYFRLSAGNMVGFGVPVLAEPFPVRITSWRQVDGLPMRFDRQTHVDLEEILQSVEALESSIKYGIRQNGLGRLAMNHMHGIPRVAGVQRRPSLKDSIKSILKVQPRMTGIGDEGLFLGCLLVCRDSFLFTADYTLPVVVIQYSPTERVGAKDFLWLQKLTSCWQLVQPIKDLLSSSRETASSLRFNILQSIIGLQSSLALENLGNLYLKPLVNKTSGTTLLLLIKNLENLEEFRTPAFKWLHFKEVELMTVGTSDKFLGLMASVGLRDLMSFNQAIESPLSPGLHLGYLQLKFDLEQVALLTDKKALTSLPSYKISENSHVTKDEWRCLIRPTDSPSKLRSGIADSWEAMKKHVSVWTHDEALHIHEEILQLAPRTTMIVTFAEKKDLAARQSFDEEQRRGMFYTAVQTFEAAYFAAHRSEAWSNYCQSVLILEALAVHITQFQRENLPLAGEVSAIKALQIKIRQHQERLDKVWNRSRWLPDLIRVATNRSAKRIPLFPKEPSLTVGIKLPVKPPRNLTKVTIKINDEPMIDEENHEDNSYSGIAATVELHSNSPEKGLLHIETDEKTTAANVIHNILSRSMSPAIIPNVARSYSLMAISGNSERILPDFVRIKDVMEDKPQTRFVLAPRKTV